METLTTPHAGLSLETMPIGAVVCGLLFLALFAGGLATDIVLWRHLRATPPRWRDRLDRLRARPWTEQDGKGLFITMAAVSVLIMLALQSLPHLAPFAESDLLAISIMSQSVVFHGVALLLVCRRLAVRGAGWGTGFGFNREQAWLHVKQGALFYLAMVPFVTTVSWAWRVLLSGLGFPISQQFAITVFVDDTFPWWLQAHLSAWAILVAPLVEELLFRGFALPLALRSLSPVRALVLAALFFACIHMHFPSLAPLFTIAMGFSLAYVWTGSLVTAIVMHAAFNSVSLLAVYLLRDSGLL